MPGCPPTPRACACAPGHGARSGLRNHVGGCPHTISVTTSTRLDLRRSTRGAAIRVRVLFVCASGGSGRLQLGGAERFVGEMLPALAATHQVAALLSDERLIEAVSAHGVQTFFARPHGRADVGYLGAINRAIKRFDPDVVSAHLLSAAMHARLSHLLRRHPPLVVTLHNSLRQYVEASSGAQRRRARTNLALDRSLRALVPHASVAVSMFEYAELTQLKPTREVHRIPNALPNDWPGLNAVDRDAARRRVGLESSRPTVLYMGRLEHEKGVDRFNSLASALATRLDFVAVGSGTQALHPSIVHRPHTETPIDYYEAADVVVVPSRVESFGRVALEAVSRGTPVVHTNIGGLPELLQASDGVLSFPRAPSTEALVDGVLAALEVRAGRPETLESAAKHYLEAYGFEQMARAWSGLLTSVGESGRR